MNQIWTASVLNSERSGVQNCSVIGFLPYKCDAEKFRVHHVVTSIVGDNIMTKPFDWE